MSSIERPFDDMCRRMLDEFGSMEATGMQVGAQAMRLDGLRGGTHGWRLTRRGRALLLGVLAVLLTAALVGWGAARSGSASTGSERYGHTTVIVTEGDTLWSIAAHVAPGTDRRTVVRQIIARNHLDGPRIEPGQRLVVPVDTP